MRKQQLVPALLFAFIAFTHGCDSGPDRTPYCETGSKDICAPPGLPFVTSARTRSDACPTGGDCASPLTLTTTVMTQPEPGKICMKGTVAGKNGFAWLILRVSEWNQAETQLVHVLDAKALGIEQVRFTIDRPPTTGLTMFATTAYREVCPAPGACLNGFDLRTGASSANIKVMDRSETVTAPFTNFANVDPKLAFDTSKLGHFIFTLGAGDYDFCVSDLAFLDASGNVVEEDRS